MRYPDEFKAECLRVYPDWPALEKALEGGSEIVGRYLDDGVVSGIRLEDVVAAEDFEALKAKARKYLERGRIYSWWCELREQQRKAGGDE